MNIMAKVSEELKSMKATGLKSCIGLLKKDKESKVIEKSLEKGWKEWSRKYASIQTR